MKKSRICWIRILFPVFAVLIFSVFLLTFKVNAASDQWYFPMTQNENSILNQTQLDFIDSVCDSENNYVFVAYQRTATYLYTQAFYYPKSYGMVVFAEINSNGYNFSLYQTESDYGLTCKTIRFYGNTGYTDNLNSNLGYFQNLTSSMYSSSANYVSNFNLYTNNNTGSRKLVLYYEVEPIPDDDTVVPGTEKPTFSDYVPDWSNAPSFDSSSVENALSSVFNSVVWFGNNVKETIIGTGKYTVDTVLWGMQQIINNIRGKLQELKESIEGIVSGIGDLIDSKFGNMFTIASSFIALGLDQGGNFSLTQMFTSLFVPSSQQIIQVVIDHDDFDFIGTSKVVIADAPRILSQLYNVTATPIFHVPSCTFHGVEIGNFDISFAWFAPYKVYYDVIVSTFLIIAYIYWIFVTLHSHIRTTYTPGPQEEEYWRY